ncbi:MAG: Gfo/Idh/MocA family oxidoreductase [Planctomycetota bacterium]|nr:Gfo/Idh/MocA family oxidoreductase [Planctomycetota bacterium]
MTTQSTAALNDAPSPAVAIVGTGFMGWVHWEALSRIGVPVVGVLGSSTEKGRRFAERFGGLSQPRAYRDFTELLADPLVTSVHVAVPNRLHFAMAKEALLAGKHVLCEKPLAMNSQESGELVELARQCPGQAAGVNYNIRYYPLCLEIRERIRAGELGELFHIAGSYVQDWLLKPTDYNWRVLADEGGELRAIADIGTHWLDLVSTVSGLEVEAVCADLFTAHPTRQRPAGEIETFQGKTDVARETTSVPISTEDYGCVMLRFRGGARGVLWVSQVTAGRKNCLRLEIAGAAQALEWNSERPNELWIGQRDRANELLLRDPALLSPGARSAADYPGGHNEGYADSFKQCFRSFYQYLTAGDFSKPAPFPTFADGHREIVLCEAILRSQKENRWVTV